MNFINSKREVSIFPTNSLTDFDGIYGELTKKLDYFKNGANLRLPLPDDAPEEIPRVSLNTGDSSFQCLIGKSKVGFIWTNGGENLTVEEKSIYSMVLEIMSILLPFTGPTKRVGNITEHYIPVDNYLSPLKDSFLTLLKDDLKAFTVQLTYNKSVTIESKTIKCNHVLTTLAAEKNNEEKIIVIQNDFNTYPEEPIKWNTSEVKTFLETSSPFMRPELFASKIIL